MAKNAAPNMMQLQQRNNSLRSLLIASAAGFVKQLQSQSCVQGGSVQIKLLNAGITTKIRLAISAAITIATAVQTPSNKAPYNLVSRVRLRDYNGTERVSCSGWQLYFLNSIRASTLFGQNTFGNTAVASNPVTPTAIGAGTISFYLDIPLAWDSDNPIVQLRDLRGSLFTQVNVGEAYVIVEFNNSLLASADEDAVYTTASGTVTTSGNAMTVVASQYYLQPQAINGEIPIPFIDLATVYEINGFTKSTDNISAGLEKLFSYPNARSVVGSYFSFVSNKLLSDNLTTVRMIANGNQIMQEYTGASKLFDQRVILDGDVGKGWTFFLHRENRIETNIYGNVQIGITPSAVAGTPYFEQMFESFYQNGQQLPGMYQGA